MTDESRGLRTPSACPGPGKPNPTSSSTVPSHRFMAVPSLHLGQCTETRSFAIAGTGRTSHRANITPYGVPVQRMWTEPRGPVPSSNRQANAADARAPTLPACRLGVRVEIRRLADGGLQGRERRTPDEP